MKELGITYTPAERRAIAARKEAQDVKRHRRSKPSKEAQNRAAIRPPVSLPLTEREQWYSTLADIDNLPETSIGPAADPERPDLFAVAADVLAEIQALPEQHFHPYKSKEH